MRSSTNCRLTGGKRGDFQCFTPLTAAAVIFPKSPLLSLTCSRSRQKKTQERVTKPHGAGANGLVYPPRVYRSFPVTAKSLLEIPYTSIKRICPNVSKKTTDITRALETLHKDKGYVRTLDLSNFFAHLKPPYPPCRFFMDKLPQIVNVQK